MKVAFALAVSLVAVTAYYFYIPLPSTISEPWKLMLLDGIFRGIVHVGKLAHWLGICHFIRVLDYTVTLDTLGPVTNENLRVTDTAVGGVNVRLYEWTGGAEGELKRGVVFFHGGGWALGSANAVRASKHFLQPEVLAQFSVDPERVAVSGDSAGGNLAAAVAQQVAMDSNVPVKFKVQSLIYPALQALDFNTPSYQQNQNVPILYRVLMVRFWLEYLNADLSLIDPLLINNHTALDQSTVDPHRPKVDWASLLPAEFREGYEPVLQALGTSRPVEEIPGLLDVRAAPLLAERDVLSRTPRAFILTCEHDVLRDDGLMYGSRLEEAGVDVTIDHHGDGFHGCLTFAFWPTHFKVGKRTLTNYISWLDQNL
ncbi:hypothetical protein JZ751_009074 [Albula glossodonta]|uniref:Neutral cholesterol ester hydrolase 1 n=1 Tax=Albula glossodonta TaxID=121402 RepID=A0A8T2N6F7_9TELE|nr:hypothetical protein JZ751_009074 [Albula glossodonta]